MVVSVGFERRASASGLQADRPIGASGQCLMKNQPIFSMNRNWASYYRRLTQFAADWIARRRRPPK
jgi:hypothetical protein